MNYKKEFPKRLKQARIEKGKTQKEMAIELNIERPSYVTYETGKTYPKFENLMKIAEILEISIDYLVGLKDNKKVNNENYNQSNNNIAIMNIRKGKNDD